MLTISNKMSSEEIAFYYTFFSVIAIQQVLEMGVGFTLKQYIAHAFKIDGNIWVEESKYCIKGIFDFSIKWYFSISLFIFFGVGYFGIQFFSNIHSVVDWKSPWILVVTLTAVFVTLIPFQLIVEGCQDQIVLFKSQLISSIINCFVLVISIVSGLGLYSIAISVAISNLVLYSLLYTNVGDKYVGLFNLKSESTFKSIFNKIWPMLSKISITWILGYFFWNSFNLISIQDLPLVLAGKFALTLSLALAGYNIVSVIVNSQTTIFSSHISSGELKKALTIFKKLNLMSIGILILGYGVYFVVELLIPEFYIFNKTLSSEYTFYIFVYCLLLLPVTNQANFSRCFKKEPYFYLSLCSNLTVPIVFYFTCAITNEPNFIYLLLPCIFFLIWSNYIFNKTLKSVVN